ncbi:hypothetical protein HYH03_006569 [Edaphochlamys debaryana]|uniref:Uncharacterized protein n=1 Tax=Edaphochlamys debaryana TaxID=47281 RepID=A0A836C0X1_9CHLO|nr:hypothetical protein HYH03_006569 [Edaphochlamys debaryana]|eukprot:KAG2495297.1 hypothetical protein HYH03_006569 [Edaphochlamys debaryana]
MALALKRPISAVRAAAPRRVALAPRPVSTHAVPPQLLATLAEVRPGDVDASIGTLLLWTAVVSAVAISIIPTALNPGQLAAERMFNFSKAKAEYKKEKAGAKKPTGGKKA